MTDAHPSSGPGADPDDDAADADRAVPGIEPLREDQDSERATVEIENDFA